MDIHTGILLALVAMVSWGIGDFFTQRTTRIVGTSKALFFNGFVGFLALAPFVLSALATITFDQFILLASLAIIVMLATVCDFEALRTGKIAVVEPIVGLELPIAIVISLVIVGEVIPPQFILIVSLVAIGTLLAVFKGGRKTASINILERGVFFAIITALSTAFGTVLVGLSSQEISPLVTIWFSQGAFMIVGLASLLTQRKFKTIYSDVKKHPITIGFHAAADNIAWVSFAVATTVVPIAIASAISGGYVAMAVALGLFINKEKIKKHQYIGIAMVSFSIVLLSYLFEG